ncbi:MAG: ATP-dependent helicase HrpB [Paracoccaceae bacterium]
MKLPIDAVLPDLLRALEHAGRAVLQAPPGAGKTTRVPLAMLAAGRISGRIVMLEPRRLAARAAAERMAASLREPVGATVGYRVRGDARTGPDTRIEVVTEGILTRMIQSDPELRGIGAVIFDEFHERSLHADLGLALTWEVRGALREDLVVVVMSATLDAAPVAAMLGDAPIVTAEGRAYPVDTRWLPRPLPQGARFDVAMADLIVQAAGDSTGGILAFLPGEGEIRRTQAALAGRLGPDCMIAPLFGAMELAAQRAAIAPAPAGLRKIVLATAIAETSLTIEDIRIVVDGGRARRARFDPGSGMSRLITERVTRAEAEQRRGRAGRVAAGICYRLWTRGEEGGLAPYPPAEIEAADLTGLALELALWGAASPGDLALLSPPNPGAYAQAQALLRDLGALDDRGRITAHGKRLAALPLHPRLAHMREIAGPQAATLAALLAERDPLGRGAPADLLLRLDAVAHPARHNANRATIERIRADARRFAAGPARPALGPAAMVALAYPDRIGLRRAGDAPRFVLANGKGAVIDAADPLAGARLIVACDLDGDMREARIRQAIALSDAELHALYADQIHWVEHCTWSRRERRVLAVQHQRFGALVLDQRPWKGASDDTIARAALDGLRDIGLTLDGGAALFRARVMLARAGGADLPDMSDDALLAGLEDWLLPHIGPLRTEAQLRAFDPDPALRAMLSWDQTAMLDRDMPAHFTSPMGRRIAIDYSGDHPTITARLQEMFGLTTHPTVGPARLPLRIILTSPAQRPLQTTMDLPGFWRSSYADVRKEMRGRYPRHPWPEDPTEAAPTLRAKPRGTGEK